jgi:ubiquinone/menaquinone biosynthesis C-methylase UbiE
MISADQEKKWSQFYTKITSGDYPKWPNETILKLFFGTYLKSKTFIKSGQTLLDVGCGTGQNFTPFLEKGLDCYGVEVHPDLCELTEHLFKERGLSVSVKYGNNQNLPFENEYFDYLLSLNVIHYEPTEEDMKKAIEEHARVLKKGGKFFLMTVGPEHIIYRQAKALGNHLYEIADFDFRNGQTFFYFDNIKYVEQYLSPYFSSIEFGRVTENLMERPLDFLIAVATK